MKKLTLLLSGLLLLLSIGLNAQQIDTLYICPNVSKEVDAYVQVNAGNTTTIDANFSTGGVLLIDAWTAGGNLKISRSLMRWDFSSIPIGSIIQSATLELFHNTNSGTGNSTEAGSNEAWVERITEDWDGDSVSWSTQPNTTTADRAQIPTDNPIGVRNIQSNANVDVTNIIQYFIDNPAEDYGIKIKLATEQYYRRRTYFSSDYTDSTLHPRLIIQYQTPINAVTKLKPPSCGKINVKSNTKLRFNAISGVSQYMVTISDSLQTDSVVVDTNFFTLSNFTNSSFMAGTTYDIKIKPVRANYIGYYGTTCSIKTINLQTTQLLPNFCNATNVEATDVLKFFPVPFATSYEVVAFTDTIIDTITITSTSFKLSDFNNLPLEVNRVYTILIKPNNGLIIGSIGNLCHVSSPISSAMNCNNLIANSSFELNQWLPNDQGQANLALNWSDLITGSPDYFHRYACQVGAVCIYDVSVPNNVFTDGGLEERTTRDAYIGMTLKSSSEYVYQNLATPLVSNRVYYASVYTAHSDKANAFGLGKGPNGSSNDIHLFFSDLAPSLPFPSGGNSISDQVQALQTITNNNWTKISGFITPSTTLNYITIGSEQGCCNQNAPNNNNPYYFFDDVVVLDLTLDASTVYYCQNGALDLGQAYTCTPPSEAIFEWRVGSTVVANTLNTSITNPTSSTYSLYMIIGATSELLGTVTATPYPTEIGEIRSYNGKSVCFDSPVFLYPYSTAYPNNNGIPTNALTATWYEVGNSTILHTGPIFSTTSPGTYVVNYVNTNGCTIEATFEVFPCCIDDSPPYVKIPAGTYGPIGTPSGSFLLPNINPGDKIFIEGTITLANYKTYAQLIKWSNNQIYVNGFTFNQAVAGSYINLENTEMILEDNCTIESTCDPMWGGFKVLSNTTHSTLSVIDCEIKDAETAVTVERQASFESIGTKFIDNYDGVIAIELQNSGTNFFKIENTDFSTLKLLTKEPYTFHLSHAGIIFDNLGNAADNSFIGNTYTNMLFGIKVLGAGLDNGSQNPIFNGPFILDIHNATFNSVYFTGVYADNDFYSSVSDISITGGTFNYPKNIPTTPSIPLQVPTYGIQLKQMHNLNVVSSTFTSPNSLNITNPKRVGIFSDKSYKDITIDNCDFTNMTRGVDITPEGTIQNGSIVRASTVNITSNTFTDNEKAIQFRRNNPIAPNIAGFSAAHSNMQFTVSCNDFVKNYTGALQLTAIYVKPNTTMVHMGVCNPTIPLLNKPAGNEMIDNANNPVNFNSIWNLSSPFVYNRWDNENFASVNNAMYFKYPYNNVTFFTCPGDDADINTCPGDPGILRPSAGGNNENTKGYTPDTRYKSKTWFTGSNLGNVVPNPATRQVTIPVTISAESRNAKVMIYSSVGKQALIDETITESKDVSIDVSSLKAGMYFYSLMINNAIVDTKKLIIK